EKKIAAGDRKVTIGLEGLYSWNWTRLGHRKFMAIGYAGHRGDTVSWNDKYVAVCAQNGKASITGIGPETKKVRLNADAGADRQVTCLVLCNNVLLLGGAIVDKGKPAGFIRAISLEDATLVWEKTFDSRLAFNGLAVDKRGIIASFDDGTVVRLKQGERPR
ncbi:MAG: hypothetical protein ACYSU0_17945, partial [Planctomycetota bacterium]